MPDERESIKVGVGEKSEIPAGAEVKETAKPEASEVGGRYLRETNVVCPHCFAVNAITEDTDSKNLYRCWNCRGTFTY